MQFYEVVKKKGEVPQSSLDTHSITHSFPFLPGMGWFQGFILKSSLWEFQSNAENADLASDRAAVLWSAAKGAMGQQLPGTFPAGS